MGLCVYTNAAGDTWCEPCYPPDVCNAGGEYSEGVCVNDSGICFFATELSSYVAEKSKGDPILQVCALHGFMIASDFREVILRRSVLGREAVELYATHAKGAIEVLRKHPELYRRALRLVTKGIRLAQDILRVYMLKGHGVVTGVFKLDHDTVREILELSAELGKHSKGLEHLVPRIEAIVKNLEGMTTEQMLDFLAPEHR
jgi:hypothetical protein